MRFYVFIPNALNSRNLTGYTEMEDSILPIVFLKHRPIRLISFLIDDAWLHEQRKTPKNESILAPFRNSYAVRNMGKSCD